MGGCGGQNLPPATQFADILTLNYTKFDQNRTKIPKFLVRGGFWVGGKGGMGGLHGPDTL